MLCYISLDIMFDIFMLSSICTLLLSRNNIIILLNFISILLLLSFKLLIVGILEFTIVIILVYQSAIIVLFLVNSLFLSTFKDKPTPFEPCLLLIMNSPIFYEGFSVVKSELYRVDCSCKLGCIIEQKNILLFF